MFNTKEELLATAQKAWETQNAPHALTILKLIQEKSALLTQNFSPDWINGLKIRMQWVAFASLPEGDQLDLISQHLLIPLQDSNFDLEKTFRLTRLSSTAATWPEEVQKYQQAFLRNNEPFGSRPLTTHNPFSSQPAAADPTADTSKPPTLGQWIKDYVDQHGMDKKDEMIVTQYLGNSRNVFSLAPDQKKVIKKLVSAFESIKVYTVDQLIRKQQEMAVQSNQQNQPDSNLEQFYTQLEQARPAAVQTSSNNQTPSQSPATDTPPAAPVPPSQQSSPAPTASSPTPAIEFKPFAQIQAKNQKNNPAPSSFPDLAPPQSSQSSQNQQPPL